MLFRPSAFPFDLLPFPIMKDLSRFLVLDLCSGTFLQAESCCLLDWSSLSDAEKEAFQEGSDTDRILIADRKGLPLR
jgi:hypothetical protein